MASYTITPCSLHAHSMLTPCSLQGHSRLAAGEQRASIDCATAGNLPRLARAYLCRRRWDQVEPRRDVSLCLESDTNQIGGLLPGRIFAQESGSGAQE